MMARPVSPRRPRQNAIAAAAVVVAGVVVAAGIFVTGAFGPASPSSATASPSVAIGGGSALGGTFSGSAPPPSSPPTASLPAGAPAFVRVNQVGYDVGQPTTRKAYLLAPVNAAGARFEVLDGSGSMAFSGPVPSVSLSSRGRGGGFG